MHTAGVIRHSTDTVFQGNNHKITYTLCIAGFTPSTFHSRTIR